MDASNANRTPYPGNIIPASDVSPQAVAFFKLIQADAPPNVAGSAITNNFATSGSGIFNNDQATGVWTEDPRPNCICLGSYTYFEWQINGNPYFGAAGGAGLVRRVCGHRHAFATRASRRAVTTSYPRHWLTDFRFGCLSESITTTMDRTSTSRSAMSLAFPKPMSATCHSTAVYPSSTSTMRATEPMAAIIVVMELLLIRFFKRRASSRR